MVSSKKVMDSFNHYVGDLLVEIRKINEIDCDDEIKGEKMQRKISAWFRGNGRFRKVFV